MKVRDLIRHLKNIDPEMDVVVEVDSTDKTDDWGIYYVKVDEISVIHAGPKLGKPKTYAITPKNGKSYILLK